MTGNLSQDWLVYVLLGAVLYFYLVVFFNSRKHQKELKKESALQGKVNK